MTSIPGVSSTKIFAFASLVDASARSRQFRSLNNPPRIKWFPTPDSEESMRSPICSFDISSEKTATE